MYTYISLGVIRLALGVRTTRIPSVIIGARLAPGVQLQRLDTPRPHLDPGVNTHYIFCNIQVSHIAGIAFELLMISQYFVFRGM